MSRRKTTEEERALFRKIIARGALLVAKPGDKRVAARSLPEAKLDLHGKTEAAAHRALLTFCEAAARHGQRRVLVVTGKSGVLKQMVPRWLAEADFKTLVAKTEQAPIRQGGEGALYVWLRKKP
jgi:DNA-nicking Smr family endonuclease